MPPNLEKKKQFWATVVTGVAFVGIMAIAAPVLFLALKGAVTLVLLGAVAAVGIAALKISPLIGMKVANWQLAAIKAEAAANPIETLQNLREERAASLVIAQQQLSKLAGTVRTFADEVAEARQSVGEKAPAVIKLTTQLEQFRKVEAQTRNHIEKAIRALANFDGEIKNAKIIYKAAKAGQAALRAAKMNAPGSYDKEKTEAALESTKDEMNMVFAELETTLNDDTMKMALMGEAPPSYQEADKKTIGNGERIQ